MTASNAAMSKNRTRVVTMEQDFAAYDVLPAELRALVRAAPLNTDPRQFADMWRKHSAQGTPIQAFVAICVRGMTRVMSEETWRTYGPRHPEANAHGRRLRRNHIAAW